MIHMLLSEEAHFCKSGIKVSDQKMWLTQLVAAYEKHGVADDLSGISLELCGREKARIQCSWPS